MNPHKWKKYSLADADISDNSNTSAAFAFLKEIEKRKDEELESGEQGSESDGTTDVFNRTRNKPKFQQSSLLRKCLDATEDENLSKSTFKASKLVMPEYNFGETKKPRKSRSNNPEKDSATRKTGQTLQLDHLLADDDDEEDDA